ncbi:TPA: hypothetical protein ACKPJR_006340 [Pseudomonas aeruginosa]
MDEHRNPNLKNKAVFTHRDLSIGMPTRVFYATLFLVSFAAFVFIKYLGWAVGLPGAAILGILIFMPVYLIHKEDPEAYIVWLRSLVSASRLTVGRSVRRRMLVLVPLEGGEFKTQSLNQQGSKK